MTALELAQRTREHLAEGAWQQFAFGFSKNRGPHIHCLVGAIHCQSDTSAIRDEGELQQRVAVKDAVVDAFVAVALPPGKSRTEVTIWNDTPGRTKEQVLGALDATIARLGGAR